MNSIQSKHNIDNDVIGEVGVGLRGEGGSSGWACGGGARARGTG